MKAALLLILLIVFGFSVIARGQDTETNKLSQISIPENLKEELVRRILVFKFKPAKRQKVIYLAKEGIDPSWLPEISNIEFRLLSDEEIEDRETGFYFFTEPDLKEKPYSIGFAFGDSQCDYIGDGWSFRITNNRLRLWYAGEIGGNCGGGRNFKTAGKLNTYPNELKDYRFFNEGKLKGLQLTVSTREDVKKNFGSDCENECDYDHDWRISFSYFGTIHKEITVDNKQIKYGPKAEYIGRIYSIELTPKQRIPFSRISFPSKFEILAGFSVGDGFDAEGCFTSARGTSYLTYLDRYGLKYTIFQDGYTVGKIKKDKRLKGDLMSIEYSIPDEIEETMFAEEQ